jgi:quinoprotein glucose dehydrogenase
VTSLAVAWEWTTADAPILAEHPRLGATNFECTPLMVAGALYGTTGLGQAFAIDAASGRTLWVFDPGGWDPTRRGGGLAFINRGMAYWSDGAKGRLFFGTGDARLFALDPRTGRPLPDFGDGGSVQTSEGIPRLPSPRYWGFGSAPTVCRDVVVMGSRIPDIAVRKTMPPGWVRGWDVRTGAERWVFHSVPLPGEPGYETWKDGSASYTGGTNAWSLITCDEEHGLVYLPFGTPTNDFYGGERRGDNLFAESLVVLDAESGRLAWYFQAVHHGVWDYDLPAPPILADITVGGRAIEAAALVTKHGFTFVLDRVTGEPVWPIEERPVPASSVPGEETSPTQPFPTRPPPFERQGIGPDDLIDFTPELYAEALAILERYDHGPLFTPPSERGALMLPSYGGGANWPGAAFDPESGWLYVPSMTRTLLLELVRPDPARSDFAWVRSGSGVEGPRGLPLVKPPWGRVTAIDLNRGEIVWTVPNGGDGPRDHPDLRHLDLPPLGSPGRAAVLATKTLLFVSEGSGRTGSAIGGGTGLRALDKRTGEELWRIELGGEVTGVPMTYMTGGRQFVVAAVGSDPPRLVALALPAATAPAERAPDR